MSLKEIRRDLGEAYVSRGSTLDFIATKGAAGHRRGRGGNGRAFPPLHKVCFSTYCINSARRDSWVSDWSLCPRSLMFDSGNSSRNPRPPIAGCRSCTEHQTGNFSSATVNMSKQLYCLLPFTACSSHR